MSARVLASATVALGLGACSFEPALTAKFVDYNRAFEDSSNSILLLNVLRAKDRKPLYFSTVSQLNPTIGATGELQLNIPLSPTSYTTLGVNTRGSVNTSNTATVATEHTHEFMRGFLQPVSIELFDYFWQQGWPRDLLLHLFVYKIEIAPKTSEPVSKNGPPPKSEVLVFVNSPPRKRIALSESEIKTCRKVLESKDFDLGFPCFQYVADLLRSLLRFATEEGKPITPEVAAPNIRDWKALVEAAKPDAKLSVVFKNGKVQIKKKGSSTILCIANPYFETDDAYHRRSSAFPCGKYPMQFSEPERGIAKTRFGRFKVPRLTKAEQDNPRLKALRQKYDQLNELCGGARAECELVIHLRSPEAMIYYLGEAARALHEREASKILLRKIETEFDKKAAASCPPEDQADGRFLALLSLDRRGDGASDAAVVYERERYSVPKRGCHRTMQALSLISIVMGLHRRASDLPRTGTVNVVGP